MFFAENLIWSLRKILFLFSFIPLYFVVSSLKNKMAWRRVIISVLSGASIASIIGILQFSLQFVIGIPSLYSFWASYISPLFLGKSFGAAVLSYPSWLVNISGATVFRAISTFPDPHMLSMFLGLVLPWTLAFACFTKDKRFIWWFLFAVVLIADLLTFSRGGYLGVAAGSFFLLFWYSKDHLKLKGFGFSIVMFIALIIALTSIAPLRERFISIFDFSEGSNSQRIETWRSAFVVIKNNPFGVGIGNYPLSIKPTADYREPIYAHSLYLDIWAELGIIGLLSWIGLIVATWKSFVQASRKNPLFLAGAGSILIFSVHSLVETGIFSFHVLPLLSILIGISTIVDE